MPRRPQTEEQRDHVRQRIIGAAQELFDANGIGGVSMRAVGMKVGLTASALYAYFPNKDELVRAIWWQAREELDRSAEALSRQETDPIEAIKALGTAYARFALEDPIRFRMLFLVQGDIHVAEIMSNGAYKELLNRVIEALEQKRFRQSDPELIAQTLWTGVHGVLSLANSWPNFPFLPPSLLVSTMMETLLAGLHSNLPKKQKE